MIDGRDILPLFTSDAKSPHEVILGAQGNRLATVRDRRWKLHVLPPRDQFAALDKPGERWIDPRGPDGVTILAPYEQYQPASIPACGPAMLRRPDSCSILQADPGEQHDVAAEHPDVVRRLTALFDKMLAEQAAVARP